MRLTLLLYGLLLLAIPPSWAASGRQAASPSRTLTPEQQEYQRQWREYMAERPDLQARAKQIL